MNISKKYKLCWASNKRARRGVAWLLCLPFFTLAQQNRLTVNPPEQVSVKRGASVPVTLRISVIRGFHVNSDKPKDEFLIPLKLTWDAGPLEAATITYPKPEEIKVGEDTLSVFTGTFDVETEMKAPEQASAGMATMSGKLRYQACNNEMCFRPTSVEVRLPVVIQ